MLPPNARTCASEIASVITLAATAMSRFNNELFPQWIQIKRSEDRLFFIRWQDDRIGSINPGIYQRIMHGGFVTTAGSMLMTIETIAIMLISPADQWPETDIRFRSTV
jgi:hypothetical protein